MIRTHFILLSLIILLFSPSVLAEDKPVVEMPAPDQTAETKEEAAPPAKVGIEETFGIVTQVIDAGTVKIDGQPMRLLGISAPRRWWWGPSRDCHSIESSKYLENLVLDKEVSYTRDPGFRHLRNGRRRIYLYLGDKQINGELISKGLVLTDRTKQYLEKERFFGLEKGAKLRDRGLWHTCLVECERNNVCRTRNW